MSEGKESGLVKENAGLAELDASLAERQYKLAQLNRTLATLDSTLAEFQGNLAVHTENIIVIQAELAQLKKTLSTMLAVVSGKQVPEEEKGFAKYFGALEPSIRHRSIEKKGDDVRDQLQRMIKDKIRSTESRISTKKEEIRVMLQNLATSEKQSAESLITELQARLIQRPRSTLLLTQSENCNQQFLGREDQLKLAMKLLRTDGVSVDDRCPVLVYSAPRQGKSRIMDEIAKRAGGGQADFEVENLAARFFSRMLLASVSLFDPDSADEFAERFPFLKTLDAKEFDRILRKVHGLSNQRIWLLADEYAKCYLSAAARKGVFAGNEIPEALMAQVSALYQFMDDSNPPINGNKIMLSGFTDAAWRFLQSASGRRVEVIPLPLIDTKGRNSCQPMMHTLLHHYYDVAKKPFPTFMYEVMKSCVGMMGNWVELCALDNYPTDLASMNVPWLVVLSRKKDVYLEVAERYLHKWGVGSLDMASFLKEEAKYFDAVDVGTSTMFLPLFTRTIAHPIPFYALTREMPADRQVEFPLVTQLRGLYQKMEEFVGKKRSASASAKEKAERITAAHHGKENSTKLLEVKKELSEKVKELRGSLVEEITYMIMRMRYCALATLNQPRPLEDCLSSWIYWNSTLSGDSVMLHPDTKPRILKHPPRCSLPTLFDGTANKDPSDLKAQVQTFCDEVFENGGLLMAPESNPGFDVVASFRATKCGKEGISLILIETSSIDDVDQHVSTEKGTLHPRDEQVPAPQSDEPEDDGIEEDEDNIEADTSAELPLVGQKSVKFCATWKAWLTLRGLNATLPHFLELGKPVLHVCYVYVTLGNFEPTFETEKIFEVRSSTPIQATSLSEALADTERKGATVSLHVVAGQEELEDFFTGAVSHVIPDA